MSHLTPDDVHWSGKTAKRSRVVIVVQCFEVGKPLPGRKSAKSKTAKVSKSKQAQRAEAAVRALWNKD
jgi:hypothetical protein